jgi:hypothetical protein
VSDRPGGTRPPLVPLIERLAPHWGTRASDLSALPARSTS